MQCALARRATTAASPALSLFRPGVSVASAAPRRLLSFTARAYDGAQAQPQPQSQSQSQSSPPSPPRFARRPRSSAPSMAAYQGPPLLSSLLKKFNLLVHPDLFAHAPEHQAQNQQSLQALNALLSALRTRERDNEYPAAQKLQLVFYVKKRAGDEEWMRWVRREEIAAMEKEQGTKKKQNARSRAPARGSSAATAAASGPPKRGDVLDGEFHIVPVLLTTTGGNCRTLIAGQLTSMFQRVGMDVQAFRWDADYWQMGGPSEWASKSPVHEEEEEEE